MRGGSRTEEAGGVHSIIRQAVRPSLDIRRYTLNEALVEGAVMILSTWSSWSASLSTRELLVLLFPACMRVWGQIIAKLQQKRVAIAAKVEEEKKKGRTEEMRH